jgi:hypothetical protein
MSKSHRTGGHRSARRKACSSEKTNKGKRVMDDRNASNFYEEKIQRRNRMVDKQSRKQKPGK